MGLKQTRLILLSTYPSCDTFHAGKYGPAAIVPTSFDLDDLCGKHGAVRGEM